MTEIEELYLQYLASITEEMMSESSAFVAMTDKTLTQFKVLGLTNEEKASALVAIYTEEAKSINAQASAAALELLKLDKVNDTEERKRQGYDDSLLIEILKAQSGLASFAVNANSDTAQDTIDDLHEIMQVIEDRVCDKICDTPSFAQSFETAYNAVYSGFVYGGEGMNYAVTEDPEKGVIVVNGDSSFTYTPQNDVDGKGNYNAIITGTDPETGNATATSFTISVVDPIGV